VLAAGSADVWHEVAPVPVDEPALAVTHAMGFKQTIACARNGHQTDDCRRNGHQTDDCKRTVTVIVNCNEHQTDDGLSAQKPNSPLFPNLASVSVSVLQQTHVPRSVSVSVPPFWRLQQKRGTEPALQKGHWLPGWVPTSTNVTRAALVPLEGNPAGSNPLREAHA